MKKIIVFIVLTSTFILAERFEIRGDTVYDSLTELTWQKNPSKSDKHSIAEIMCTDPWHLPHIDELKSLVDYTKSPAIATTLIKIETDDYYWTSSQGDSSSWWVVNFYYGNGFWYLNDYNSYVLCVQ